MPFSAIVVLASLLGHPSDASWQQAMSSLGLEGRLDERTPREFIVSAGVGEFLEFNISLGGVARAQLTSPDGRLIAEAFADHRCRVNHLLAIVAAADGEYRLKLVPSDRGGTPSYRVTLSAHRVADDRDRARAHVAGLVLDALGAAHAGSQRDFERAADLASKAHAMALQLEDDNLEERTLRALGHVDASLRQYARGRERFEAAALLAGRLGDREALAESLFGLGEAQVSSVSPAAALPSYQRALAIWYELNNPLGLGATLDHLGVVHHLSGDAAAALSSLDHALPYRRAAGDQIGEALTLHNRGMIAFYIGDADTAVARIQEALAVNGTTGDLRAVPHYTTSLARAYTALGEPQRAFDAFTTALALWRQSGDPWGEALTLGHMGETLDQIGDAERALSQFAEASARYRVLGDRRLEGRMLTRMGLVHERRRDFSKALALHREALARLQGGFDRAHEAEALTAIGRCLVALRRTRPGRDTLNRALELVRHLTDRRGEARILHELGRTAALEGDLANARRLFDQALALAVELGDREHHAATLFERARLARQAGQLEDALVDVERALDVDDETRARVLAPGLRLAYSSSRKERHDEHVHLLYTLHQRHPQAGYDRRAFEAHERGRTRALVDALREASVDIYRGTDPATLERLRLARARINALEERQFRTPPSRPADRTAIQSEIRALLDEHERLEAALRASRPGYAAVTAPQPPRIEHIQAALDDESRMLVYHVGSSIALLWIIGPESSDMVSLPRHRELEPRIRRVVDLLEQSQRQTVRSALRLELALLTRQILDPVAPNLAARRLIVAPDGLLHYLPFAALPLSPADRTELAGDETLLTRYEIAYVPSATAMMVARQATTQWRVEGTIGVVADPVFDASDSRVRSVEINAQPRRGPASPHSTPDAALAQRSARAVGIPLTRLLHSRREAEALSRLAGASTSVALDFDASLTGLDALRLGDHHIIHFATHAFLHDAHPELSGLVLSLVDRQGQPQAGFLRLHDVYRLRLRAGLVVLSACQTALGREHRGEGLIGLARGFTYAGAERVLVSLWKVSDEATAVLMEAFYTSLLREGQTPAAALRTAQQHLAQSQRWSAPYHWAGFVLQGDWR